ncbi:MAG: hemerythrin domain-containing protein [Chloroflexi bacterium]|nr:hemerythrin domain-containing protein [Chloroflexota bacterium]
MRPTEALMDDHVAIKRVLKALSIAADRVDAGQKADVDVFAKSVDFVVNYADKCHHGKEESALFPLLEAYGLPREAGPVGVMLMEHEQGRKYIGSLAKAIERFRAGDASASKEIASSARGYVTTMYNHILKEEDILFQMADGMMTEEDGTALLEQFEEIEQKTTAPGAHERYLQLVDEIEAEA